MSSFISVKEHARQCKILKNEIESLRQQLKHSAKEIKEQHKAKNEWKRRLQEYKEMVESLPGSICVLGDGIAPYPLESVSYHEAVRRKYPKVNSWFEEE